MKRNTCKKKTMKQKDGSQTSDFKLALVSRFADIRLGACAFFVPGTGQIRHHTNKEQKNYSFVNRQATSQHLLTSI